SYAGTGKTYTLMKMLDEYLFLVPTRAILNDLANKHAKNDSVIFVGGGLGGFDESVLEYKKIVMTYDQFEQYLKYCNGTPKHKRLIIDECHKLGQYSNITTEKAKKLQLIHDKTIQFEQRIYVSATVYNMPDIFDYVMSFYRPQQRPIKVYQLEQRPHGTKSNQSKEYFSALKQVLNKEKKSFILCNMIKLEEIEKLAELLAAHFECKIDIIHSKSKENDSYKHIFKGKDKGKVTQIVLATGLLNVGVDMQKTFEHSYIIGTHDPNDIEQAINRERQAEQFHIILPNKENTTLSIKRDLVHTTLKRQIKTIKTEQEITLKVPYTTKSLVILDKKDVLNYEEKQYTERVTLYNDNAIKKTLTGEFETDLFIVQAEIYQVFIRNNMTTSTLLELLKPIYPKLDTTVTTLTTDFDEPTKQTKREAQDITQVRMKDIQTFMGKVSLAISSAKKDVFKGYSPELLESVEFDLLTTLARNIAIAEALDNHLAEQPIQKTIKVISKESKNLEL
ncbi:MAG: DEAD/DEAH box helicase family protein, partial [Culicoidibacterales bacterium]